MRIGERSKLKDGKLLNRVIRINDKSYDPS